MRDHLQSLALLLQPRWTQQVDDFVETTVKKKFRLNDNFPGLQEKDKPCNALVENHDPNFTQTNVVHFERLIDSCYPGRNNIVKCDFLLYKENCLSTLAFVELSQGKQEYAEGKPLETGSKFAHAQKQLSASIELLARVNPNFEDYGQCLAVYAYRLTDVPGNHPMKHTQKAFAGAVSPSRTLNITMPHGFRFRAVRYPSSIVL